MSMSKRLQVPIEPSDEETLKAAARKEGKSLAEWARIHLLAEAKRTLGLRSISPRQALERLFAMNAPVDGIDEMNQEILKGRLS